MANFLDDRLPEKFWNNTITDPNGGCWLWIAGLTGGGYGAAYAKGRQRPAHRLSYETLVGPVAPGLDLDHLCRIRSCCNPHHLEPVTRRENLLRGETIAAANAIKTHCERGHALVPDNVWSNESHPGRQCKTCFYAMRDRRVAALTPEDRSRINAAQKARRIARKAVAL